MSNIYDEYDERLRNAYKRDRVMKDGEIIKVPLLLMDDKSKATKANEPPTPFRYADARPKSATLDDAECERRQKRYADHDARLSDAWRQGADLPEGDDG